MTEYWTPDLGDIVWLNYPDFHEPEGKVVGFVEGDVPRKGQPIIEAVADGPSGYFVKGRKKGDRFVIHPVFLLPFQFGGPEWKKADEEGRIGEQ